MAKEADFQSKVIKWLKSKGCYVIKHTANPGVPVGCPDLSFYKEGFYGFIEVKPSKTAKFQPLQKETIAKLDMWSWAKVVTPDVWPSIQKELALLLKD